MGLGWVYLIPTGWKQEKQNGSHLNVLVHSASKTQASLWVSKVLFYELVFFFGINRFILQKTSSNQKPRFLLKKREQANFQSVFLLKLNVPLK